MNPSRDLCNRATPAPASAIFSLPTGPFRFIALDVETANSDSSSICQIGIACVRHDGTVHVASTLIDPGQPFSDFNVNLHGIGPAQVRGAPKFPTVLHHIAPLLGQQIIIQHSTFDRSAINGACRAYGIPEPGWQWADSVQIARRAWPEFRGNGGHGLGHLKQALALDFEHHDAGEDAKAAALVVLRAEAHTGQYLEDLIAPARKSPAKPRKPKTQIAMPDPSDIFPALDSLARLTALLTETPPMPLNERERMWKTNRRAAVSRMLETGETFGQASGAQAFYNLPDDQFRSHLRSTDNDLAAQVEIVEGACRTYFATGEIPAPYFAWRIAIILSKGKQADHERAFLAAWCIHFGETAGTRYEALADRARKRGIAV